MESPNSENSQSMKIIDQSNFYNDAAQYWSKVPPTVDGMLGGFGHISAVDIHGSNQFLKQLFRLKEPPGKGRALDCGAGIGRITSNLLFNHFDKVDMVEQNPSFVAQARFCPSHTQENGKFLLFWFTEFLSEPASYDAIWCQWVLGHLTDDDLIAFLRSCIRGLKINGMIILKENSTSTDTINVDTTDSSVTRPLHLWCALLEKAGLQCVRQKRQGNFPRGLYPVYMIATRPSLEKTSSITGSETAPLESESKEPSAVLFSSVQENNMKHALLDDSESPLVDHFQRDNSIYNGVKISTSVDDAPQN